MALNFKGFVREVYLRSTPSVDLDNLSAGQQVNCSNHKLQLTEYNKILKEYQVAEESDELLACNMFMLQSGPLLIDDTKVS